MGWGGGMVDAVGLSPTEDCTSWEFESPPQHFCKYYPPIAVLVGISEDYPPIAVLVGISEGLSAHSSVGRAAAS